jgi:hypothetical protein
VLVGGVVHDEVGDHPDAPIVRGTDDLDELAEGAEARVDAVVVGDVVAVVSVGRGLERHQPEHADAEAGEVVDALGEAGEVAGPVAVPVEEGLDVQAVDDGALPPLVAGDLDAHSSGRTLPA